jgi:hypothetical protein
MDDDAFFGFGTQLELAIPPPSCSPEEDRLVVRTAPFDSKALLAGQTSRAGCGLCRACLFGGGARRHLPC